MTTKSDSDQPQASVTPADVKDAQESQVFGEAVRDAETIDIPTDAEKRESAPEDEPDEGEDWDEDYVNENGGWIVYIDPIDNQQKRIPRFEYRG